jgi:hypothetical protein
VSDEIVAAVVAVDNGVSDEPLAPPPMLGFLTTLA